MTALVQHNSTTAQYTSGTSATLAPAFSVNATAGNCLVACFFLASSIFGPTVSSVKLATSADNWTLAESVTDSSGNLIVIYVDPNTAGGAETVNIAFAFGGTATTSNSVVALADIYEFSGVLTSSIVDKVHSTTANPAGGSSSWTSGATTTTAQAAELWIGCAGVTISASNTTATQTGPGSFTNETALGTYYQIGGTGTGDRFYVYEQSGYEIVSSTGTATYSGTSSQSLYQSSAVVATLKAVATTGKNGILAVMLP